MNIFGQCYKLKNIFETCYKFRNVLGIFFEHVTNSENVLRIFWTQTVPVWNNFLAERSGAHWGARAPHQAQQAGKEWRARRARPKAAGGADLGVRAQRGPHRPTQARERRGRDYCLKRAAASQTPNFYLAYQTHQIEITHNTNRRRRGRAEA